METALLVTGGESPPESVIRSRLGEFSFVCAADSGLDTLRGWGMDADLVVGDMDSLSSRALLEAYPPEAVLRYPREKDDTDTELGIAALRARGFGRIVLAGGGGGRLDHLLAIRALLEREDGPDEWITASERLVRVRAKTSFATEPGDTVSVFPLAGGAGGMSSSGLRWPLSGLSWDAGHFGVSNVSVSGRVEIDPGRTPVLVVLPLAAPLRPAVTRSPAGH